MSRIPRLPVLVACAAALTWCGGALPVAQSQVPKVYVTPAASALVQAGLAEAAPAGPEAAAFEEVPSPGVRFLPNVARATNLPWIDSNGWRFARGHPWIHPRNGHDV